MIGLSGLVLGQTDYYIAEKCLNGVCKQAIFDKQGNRITKWFKEIRGYGLVQDKSNYYIVTEDGKEAIFDKDGNRISDWFDQIEPDGLVKGKSNYYLVRKDWKYAIFDKDRKQVTDWFNVTYLSDSVDRHSNRYILGIKDGLGYIFTTSSTKILGPFESIQDYGFFYDPSKNIIRVKTSAGQYVTFTKQEVDDFLEGEEIEDGRTK
jgi:hypothetical protein